MLNGASRKEREIGIALIGAGNIASLQARAIAEIVRARLRVVYATRPERARQLATAYGADWTTDLQEAVTRDDVQLVSVCTPSGAHLEPAMAAARAGKHVLVEKPLEVTLDRADRIIEACRQAGVLLGCVFQSRLKEGVRYAREALAAGRLGRLTLADAYVKWYRPASYYMQGGWRGTWALDGGGALMNQSIHTVDLLQYLAGPVASVYARAATLVHAIEAEDTAVAVLSFANGALGVIEGTTTAYPGSPARIELHGDRGTIVLTEGQVTRWDVDGATGEERTRVMVEALGGTGAADPLAIGYEGHRRQIADMVDAILTGRPPLIDGAEGRKAVEIIRAIYRSAQIGQPVTLPLIE
ncbi:MAG: Gfo/Idh/MocA family oxidoreductase [Anaerolineae bacterium]|nr:Gfo/Idh/MocA family oxidoreductase [Anaerolineae bacterium]MDW8100697.1 Gfo/Idh/MocA family oxidoreductase [Anaerolineae bacterium]